MGRVEVLYFGLAGKKNHVSLRKRIQQLIRHSVIAGPHHGGEILWQLRGYKNFEVYYYPTGNPPEPRRIEEKLISDFESYTGKLPFANRQK